MPASRSAAATRSPPIAAVVVADHGEHPERRPQTGERGGDLFDRHVAREERPGVDVVAEQQADVGALGVDAVDDLVDLAILHMQGSGMQVGDDRDLQTIQRGRPARQIDLGLPQP